MPNPRDVDIEKGTVYAVEQGIDYLVPAVQEHLFDNLVLMKEEDFMALFEKLYHN